MCPMQQNLRLSSVIIGGIVLDRVAGQLWVATDYLFAEEIPQYFRKYLLSNHLY